MEVRYQYRVTFWIFVRFQFLRSKFFSNEPRCHETDEEGFSHERKRFIFVEHSANNSFTYNFVLIKQEVWDEHLGCYLDKQNKRMTLRGLVIVRSIVRPEMRPCLLEKSSNTQ